MSNKLFEFAYCGDFSKKLLYLSQIAEHENWYYDVENLSDNDKKFGVLYLYIHNIFLKHSMDEKITFIGDYAIINTGLMTPNGEDIFMYFEKNRYPISENQNYFLKTFITTSSRLLPANLRGHLPEPIDFFEKCPELAYFDTRLKIVLNIDHIYDENRTRLPGMIKTVERETAIDILNGALNRAIKKAKRNNRLVVPQFFSTTGEIQYLMPIIVFKEIIPLVLEKQDLEYRANTFLTIPMAYNNARLIMKPESNWLSIEKKSTT